MKKQLWWSILLLIPGVALASAESDELDCLSLNIYHEARGETLEGQMAVALVTMNRVLDRRYPATVCDVVWQRSQFSWTHDGRSDHPRDERAWVRAKRIATLVIEDYHDILEHTDGSFDLTNGALYYYAPRQVRPYWATQKVVTRQIGSHLFLRD